METAIEILTRKLKMIDESLNYHTTELMDIKKRQKESQHETVRLEIERSEIIQALDKLKA